MTAPTAPQRSGTSTARQVADAVLYEGYVLYPYRASAMKNSYRWQWGVVVPQQQVEVSVGESGQLSCDVPLQATPDTRVSVTARFLQLCHRQVLDPDGTPVDRWEAGPGDDDLLLTWDEGHEREVRTPPLPVFKLLETPFTQSARLDPSTTSRSNADGSRVERVFEEVVAEVQLSATEVDDGVEGVEGVVRIHVDVRNVTPWAEPDADRDTLLRRSMVGTHLLLSALGGAFGSVVDPPDWAASVECHSRGLYPVLAGDDGEHGEGGEDDVVLAAPIILEDHPKVAPESPGPAFDALEIDELMALAVQGMTDEEKREARATDPRAAELVDTFGSLPPAVMQRLHGKIREFGPGAEIREFGPGAEIREFGPGAEAVGLRSAAGMRPEPEADVDEETADFFGVGEQPLEQVEVGGRVLAVGDTVTLAPRRRADAHDIFAAGRAAKVERMVRTVDGDTMVAVTLDDDPAAELHRWYGRFQYFHLDEIELPDEPAEPQQGDES